MRVREYTPQDLEALRAMHARQGFDYPFPDLADPIFVSKLVVEQGLPSPERGPRVAGKASSGDQSEELGRSDGAGRAVMASLARLTCEIYLLADPAVGTPRERYARLLELHRAAERDLLARGLEDVHAWLPPQIAKKFGRRLERLGWVRDDAWTPYCRRLREK